MKHLKEKDLSLDKQEVSNLTGGSDTKDKTDNELICASKVCTDSHFEICCAVSVEDTCPEQCPVVHTVDICPVTGNYNTCACPETDKSICVDCSDTPDCLHPITETEHC